VATRRAFLSTLAGGLLAAPLAAEAQSTKVPRIAFNEAGSRSPTAISSKPFAMGYAISAMWKASIAIEDRWADGLPRLKNLFPWSDVTHQEGNSQALASSSTSRPPRPSV
jgi:hypothetical protein